MLAGVLFCNFKSCRPAELPMVLVESSYVNEALLYVSLSISWEVSPYMTLIFHFFL